MDDRSNKQKIIDAIKSEGKPLQPKEIAEITEIGAETVRTTVRLMLHKGELSQPDYGLYDLPESKQQLDIVASGLPGGILKTHDVQGNVQVDPPAKIGKSTYTETPKQPEQVKGDSGTLEEKILSLVDLDAMATLIDAGAGDVQEGFYSVFKRVYNGEVYRLTVRVDVQRETDAKPNQGPKTNEGPPGSREATE